MKQQRRSTAATAITSLIGGVLWISITTTSLVVYRAIQNTSNFSRHALPQEEENNLNMVNSKRKRRETNLHQSQQTQHTSREKPHKFGFIHIPKTGGSSIEIAGAKEGLNWGSCMFKPLLPETNDDIQSNTTIECPTDEIRELFRGRPVPRNVRRSLAPWHVPMQCIPNPFYRDLFEELFVVVRNPFDRMLSEYYFNCEDFGLHRCNKDNRNDPAFMNGWIQESITKQATSDDPKCNQYARGHFIRQSDFVYHGTRRVVKHILRMEHLEEDFQHLMNSHVSTQHITLPTQKEKSRDTSQDILSVHDFTSTTVEIIQKMYAEDFELGNYSLTIM
jgi:hypothetical protein